MSEESDLEKTEAASPRRLEKAREEGQVARSRELGTFALLAAGAAALWLAGPAMYRDLRGVVRHGLAFDQRIIHDPGVMVAMAVDSAGQVLLMLLPIFVVLMVAAVVSSIVLGGLVFSAQALAPKFSKISPIAGIKRMFSAQTLAELFKAVAKAVMVGGIGAMVIWHYHREMLALMHAAAPEALARMISVVALCAALIISSLLIIVALDVPWQLWQHYKKLRMSKQDVKQEHKESDGDPHIKARIRQEQRAMARRRMMTEVPKADVVVTNPTHFAVALKYNEAGGGAPKVIAKGSGLIALKIRELAAQHRIPTLEAPPLARALHKHVDIGQEIPADLYTAVAEVLAWVFQLRVWRPGFGVHPVAPSQLAVPPALDPQASSAGVE